MPHSLKRQRLIGRPLLILGRPLKRRMTRAATVSQTEQWYCLPNGTMVAAEPQHKGRHACSCVVFRIKKVSCIRITCTATDLVQAAYHNLFSNNHEYPQGAATSSILTITVADMWCSDELPEGTATPKNCRSNKERTATPKNYHSNNHGCRPGAATSCPEG
jgi:hypothetical protein